MTRLKMAALVCALCLACSGCATVAQRRADAAFKRGDYVSAAGLYDEAVREKPDNKRLVAKRWTARARAVSELALNTQNLRKNGKQEQALAMARATVDARRDWFGAAHAVRLDAQTHAQVDELAQWAVSTVSSSIRRELDARRPLVAQRAAGSAAGLFAAAGLTPRLEELSAQVRAAGQARCDDLKSKLTPGAVHLTYWVAAYCQAFESDPPPIPASVEQVGALKIQTNTLSPTTTAERAAVEQRIEQVLVASPWFHRLAEPMAAVSISGSHSAMFSERMAPREAHWAEKVTYQLQEAYQQAYTQTEYYTAQEPYTTYRSESYSCGYGTSARTCSRSVPSTHYRTVQRSRPVTKYRTQYRTVTRFRDEPRIFRYEVLEHRGVYAAAWTFSLTLAANVPPLSWRVAADFSAQDDEHDVSFVPAGVSPARSKLMSPDEWFRGRLTPMEVESKRALKEHWRQTFCADAAPAAEAAARCARGAQQAAPEATKHVLSEFLEDDCGLLLSAADPLADSTK